MITPIYQYFLIFIYDTMHPCMTNVSDNLHSSIITKTTCEIFTNIFNRMRETHIIEYTPNTTGYTVTKPLHQHLSHRYNLRDQRIVYHHQHKPVPQHNDYIIDLNSHSQFINLSAISPHLY